MKKFKIVLVLLCTFFAVSVATKSKKAQNGYWLGFITVVNNTGRIVNIDLEYMKKDDAGNSALAHRAAVTVNPEETTSISLGRGLPGKAFGQRAYEEFLEKMTAKTLEDYNATGTLFGPFENNAQFKLSLSSTKDPVLLWTDTKLKIEKATR